MREGGAEDGSAPPLLVLGTDMDRGVLADLHQHADHLLLWSATATVRVHAADRDWLVPPTHALWMPAGCSHAGDVLRPGRSYGVLLDAARCPVSWSGPTGVLMTPLLRELVLHLAPGPVGTGPAGTNSAGTGPISNRPVSNRPDGGTPAGSSARGSSAAGSSAGLVRVPGDSSATRRAAEALLLELLEPAPSTAFHVPRPSDPRAGAIADALIANPADQRDLATWASSTNTSVRTITRLFVGETGMTFAQWRLHARVQAAVTRLARGASVESAARAVGYRKPAAFSEAFRRVTGQHPALYRGDDAR